MIQIVIMSPAQRSLYPNDRLVCEVSSPKIRDVSSLTTRSGLCTRERQPLASSCELVSSWLLMKVTTQCIFIVPAGLIRMGSPALFCICKPGGGSGRLSAVKSEFHPSTTPPILKNYLYVQTPTKEALFVPMHAERIERSAAVKITAEQMARPPLPPESAEDDEKYAALDQSMDGTVWKIEIQGVDIPKAYGMLEQSVGMIQKKLNYQLHQQQQQQQQQLDGTSAHSTPTEQQEIIFPRAIADAVQQQVGATVRDRIRNVQVDFAASSSKSKQFSRMTVEGTLLSDVHKANDLLWKLLVKLCDDMLDCHTRRIVLSTRIWGSTDVN